jgi:hypothetical protein
LFTSNQLDNTFRRTRKPVKASCRTVIQRVTINDYSKIYKAELKTL